MRVRQARGHLDLAQKPVCADLGGDFRPEHLERYTPVVTQILDKEDDGHTAFTELALHNVAASEAGFEACLQVGHWTVKMFRGEGCG